MIFRRSTPPAPTRNTAKTPMQTNGNKGQNNSTGNNLSARREPGFSGQSEQTMTITPPLNPNMNPNMNSLSNPPVSPLAAAQARRNPNGPAPAGYTRQDQQRKLIVGRDITLNGEIATCDHLVVEGTVSATVKDGQILEILEKGSFNGQVEIEQADISGKFEGELTVRGKLTVRATATITGIIQYGSLQVDHGAVVNGQITAIAKQNAPAVVTPLHETNTLNTSPIAPTNSMSNTTTMQQNTYLSSVLDQPGFLKMSGQ